MTWGYPRLRKLSFFFLRIFAGGTILGKQQRGFFGSGRRDGMIYWDGIYFFSIFGTMNMVYNNGIMGYNNGIIGESGMKYDEMILG